MKKKYECLNCEGVMEVDIELDEKDIKCCEKPNLKLLWVSQIEGDPKIAFGKCYEDIIEVLKYYLDLPEDYYKFLAVWIIGTYFHKHFSSFPFLFFNAMRGSGKTRTLLLISHLASMGDGSVLNDVTEAVLFRTAQGTTTCIDELETIRSKEKSVLRQLLNSAYKKGVKVKRMREIRKDGKQERVAEEFEPYIPIAMANIRGLDEVLEDRAFTLVLDKSSNPRITKKAEDFSENDKIREIKRDLVSFMSILHSVVSKKNYIREWNNYINSLYNDTNNIYTYTTHTTQTTTLNNKEDKIRLLEQEELFNKINESGVDGRNFELLFPLLIVSYELGDEVFNDILRIGVELINQKKKEETSESVDVSLIEYVATMEEQTRFSYLPMKSVLSGFRSYLGETNIEDTWLNIKWLGRALKRLNLIGDKRRLAGGREVILNLDKAKQQLKRFKNDIPNKMPKM